MEGVTKETMKAPPVPSLCHSQTIVLHCQGLNESATDSGV